MGPTKWPRFYWGSSKCSKGWTFECYLLCTYGHSRYTICNLTYSTLNKSTFAEPCTMGDSWMKIESKSPDPYQFTIHSQAIRQDLPPGWG